MKFNEKFDAFAMAIGQHIMRDVLLPEAAEE